MFVSRSRIRGIVAFIGLVTSLSCWVSPAAAQPKYIVKAETAVSGFEGDTVLLTALNACDAPVHIVMSLVNSVTGDIIGSAWDADVPAGRSAQLDVVLGPLVSGAAHRVAGNIVVSPTADSSNAPKCLRGKNSPILGQLELVTPGGAHLLLPAVQKVREAR
jgi:hypothetical protein